MCIPSSTATQSTVSETGMTVPSGRFDPSSKSVVVTLRMVAAIETSPACEERLPWLMGPTMTMGISSKASKKLTVTQPTGDAPLVPSVVKLVEVVPDSRCCAPAEGRARRSVAAAANAGATAWARTIARGA